MGRHGLVEPPTGPMTREQFRAWAALQSSGRFERLDGTVVAMAPERVGHALVKANVRQELRRAVRRAGVGCQALPDGITVEIDEETDFEPDALVNCGERLDPNSVVALNPVIVVEVESRSTRGIDSGLKLPGYFRVPSVHHYLIVGVQRRTVVHHRRTPEGIATAILQSGPVELDPPGITIDIAAFYED